MKTPLWCRLLLTATALFAQSLSANKATTLHLAYKADISSLDPHGIAEATQLDVLNNVYQGLVRFDNQGQVQPELAIRWEQLSSTTWRFHLRPNVRFAEGQPFTSQDVAFNFTRANAEHSGVRVFVDAIKRVDIIDPLTVDLQLHREKPDLLRALAAWYQLSTSWCAAHDCRLDAADAYVKSHTNGTGPYTVSKREPGVVTRFQRLTANQINSISAVDLRIIPNDTQRWTALSNGSADLINPLPLAQYAATQQNTALQAISRADMRVLFLGMDHYRSELLYSSIKGRNPLQDVRVRQALYFAIDVHQLQTEVMQGVARPTALLIPKGVWGYDETLDQPPAYNPSKARELLAQAGCPQGFQLRLNCPNDRYLNDEALCRAIGRQLALVGITLDLKIEPKAQFFQQVLSGDTSFYLLGAGTNTDDALSILAPVLGSNGKGELGGLNIGHFQHPRVDELLIQAGATTQPALQMRYYREIQQLAHQQVSHIPLLQPAALVGAKAGLQLHFTPENGIPWDQIQLNSTNEDPMNSSLHQKATAADCQAHSSNCSAALPTTQSTSQPTSQPKIQADTSAQISQVQPATASNIPASDPRHDFDFLVGDWLVENKRLKQRFVGSNDWETFTARQTNQPLPAGIGNYDDFVATDWRPDFVGMSFRVFNPVTQLWSIYWLDNHSGGLNTQGQLNPPVVGKFDAGVGIFSGDDVIEGRPVKVRYTWSNITPNSAHWEQAMSTDNGASWEVNWQMQMTRVVAAN